MEQLQRLSLEAPELVGKYDVEKLKNIHYPAITMAGKCPKCNSFTIRQMMGKQAQIMKRNREFTMWQGCSECGNKFMMGVNDNTFLVHDTTPGEFCFEKRTLKEGMEDIQNASTKTRLYSNS